MSKLEKYPKYKDSGIEWLGEIPEHWEARKLELYFIERKEKVSDKDFKPLSVTKKGIVPQLDNAAKTNDGDNRKLVKKGDFVINSRSDRKGSSGLSRLEGSVSLINIVLKPINIDLEFINFLLKSNYFVEEFYRNGHGIVADLWTTRFWDMKSIILPLPPKQEQTKIANYLDKKTAQIDKAISLKEQMIERLKEQRQIIINDAVTKGEMRKNHQLLDDFSIGTKGDVQSTADGVKKKMKNSGIEWLGEIPEHWEVRKLKYLFSFNKGLTITKENLQDDGIFCVNYGEIHSKYGFKVNPKIHKLKCVSKVYLENNKDSLLSNGDFVFADTSEDIEGSGNFTYLNSDIKTFAGYHTIICRPKNATNSRFFAYEFSSLNFKNQIRKKVKGVKVYSITQSILKDLILWIPPKEEQQQIVEYIDNQTAKIDKAIELQQNYIEKLKEYKATLIDSVVTGKVRVI